MGSKHRSTSVLGQPSRLSPNTMGVHRPSRDVFYLGRRNLEHLEEVQRQKGPHEPERNIPALPQPASLGNLSERSMNPRKTGATGASHLPGSLCPSGGLSAAAWVAPLPVSTLSPPEQAPVHFLRGRVEAPS